MKEKCPDGFFEFSKPQKKKSDLAEWKKHFKKIGIKTVVIERDGKYILCREGIDENEDEEAGE